MDYAAVFVRLRAEGAEEALSAIRAIEGVEVHHLDASTGRLIVTTGAPGMDAQTSRLAELRRVEGVLVAEPVYAYRDADDAGDPAPASQPSRSPSAVPGAPS